MGDDDYKQENDDDFYTVKDDDYGYAPDDDYGQHAHQMEVENKETSSLYFILFSTLLFGVLIMSKYLHEAPTLNKYLSEASLILIVGLIASFLAETFLQYEDTHSINYDYEGEDIAFQRLISFSPNIFFMALLPPILFNSGYQLRRELFLRHIYPIVMFALAGTIISSIVCAMALWGLQQLNGFDSFEPTLLELFAFGSLIAATDTVSVIAVLQAKRVDPHLFYVVFGESALNDAVALVLFNSFADLLRANKEYSYEAFMAFFPEFSIDAIGSPVLGMVFGFGAALLFKRVDLRKKKYRMLELSLYLMLMYVPFIIAESFHLSGIVAIFFTGLSVRRYVAPNVSRVTEKAGATIFQLVAFLSETCIFLELGLSIFGFSGHFHWDFIFYSLVCCLLARAAAVYPLALLHNVAVAREQKLAATETAHPVDPSHAPAFDGNGQPIHQAGAVSQQPKQPVIPPTVDISQQHATTTFPSPQAAVQNQQAQYVPPVPAGTEHVISAIDEQKPSTFVSPQPLPDGQPQQQQPQSNPPAPFVQHPAGDSAQPTPVAQNTSHPQDFSMPQPSSSVPHFLGHPPTPLTMGEPTPVAHNLSHHPLDPGIDTALTAPSASLPDPPFMHPGATPPNHHPFQPVVGLNEAGRFRRRSRGNSFDSEDTHGSRTTVTTHQSRKRRERRGRLMNNVKKERISSEMMHILWFAGLRGAVAYACVREFPDIHGNADRFTAATMFIVLFTIVIMGGFVDSMLGWLKIETGVDLEEYMDIFRQEQEPSGFFHDMEHYLYEIATRKAEKQPKSTDSANSGMGAAPETPPAFLGVDSNAFPSMQSEQDYYNWTGFEMACFPDMADFVQDPFPASATGVGTPDIGGVAAVYHAALSARQQQQQHVSPEEDHNTPPQSLPNIT